MDDSNIVALYLNRDETAIRHTADRYGSRLRSLAYGIVQDAQAAEECENDTYLQAWESIPPNEPRTYLYPFLARITRHIALDLCRKRERLKRGGHICQLDLEMAQCLPAGDDRLLESLAFRELLNGFLATLGEEKRNIFLRRYWFLDSVEEIAERYAVSQSKVKSVLLRCRRQMKAYLEKEGQKI